MVKRIFAAVKESCERLQTDYVDVFQVCPPLRNVANGQCHRFDNDTPVRSCEMLLKRY
jgi:aryl-alcohol dehydrogenase-like predicted oxidoreductase